MSSAYPCTIGNIPNPSYNPLWRGKNLTCSSRSHTELIRRLELSTKRLFQSMRCHTIPQPRNLSFFGREEILNSVDEAFEAQSSLGSVALWGTGGIGKTQLALEFAHRRWSQNTDVVLWIGTETPAEVAKSFNDAAKALDLDTDVERNTPDENRHQVLQWIQKTGKACCDQMF